MWHTPKRQVRLQSRWGHTSWLISVELITSGVFTLHTWRMKKVRYYFSLEVATISTKLHQAPLIACISSKRCKTGKKYQKRRKMLFFLTVGMASKDQITLGSFKTGITQAITNLPLGSHSPTERKANKQQLLHWTAVLLGQRPGRSSQESFTQSAACFFFCNG